MSGSPKSRMTIYLKAEHLKVLQGLADARKWSINQYVAELVSVHVRNHSEPSQERGEGYHIMIAEFEANDIAAIPICTDGKFRVHRCTIVGEKILEER